MNKRNLFTGFWAALLLAFGLSVGLTTPAVAQRGPADDGDYQILKASYGTAERNVDVTERLKELARSDVTFRMGNDTFGVDPHPNRVKTLRIYTRGRDGRNRVFEYAEGSLVDGARFTGWGGGNWGGGGWNGGWGNGEVQAGGPGDAGSFQILQASYGTAAHHVDVTQRLKELARGDRSFRLGNDNFGVDPDPNRVKMLRIYTRAADGRDRMFEYTEGSVVDGARFTAWGSGNWGRGGWSGGWGDANAAGQLNIVSASYGAGNRQRDITDRLRARVQNDRLDVRADNDLAGLDPAPSMPKTLSVTYTVGGGREQRARVAESERLTLP